MDRSTKNNYEKLLRRTYAYDVRNQVGRGLIASGYRERQTMIVNHAVDHEVFYRNDAEMVHDFPALLMSEIVAPEGDTFMHPRHGFTVLAPFRCAFREFGVLALHLCQRLFFLAEKPGIGNFFTRREGGKRFESNVNAHGFRTLRQPLRFAFNREGGIPLASSRTSDRERFDLPAHRAMQDHLDMPTTRGRELALPVDLKTRLGEGERVVAVCSTKTRKPRLLTSFAAAKEGFEGQINTYRHVLQDLRVDSAQRGTFLLEHRIGGLLPIARKRRALLLI